ncbi:MAG: alanine--tRNA ligase [Candidatus Anstonellaceae archaeon]
MDKDQLRAKFASEWEKHYKVETLIERGFFRQKCGKCGRHFWAVQQREICSDAACMGYKFIGKKMAKEPLEYVQTWKKIEEYFTNNGHTSLESYPTVARWRDDLYFTIASISDFQPYVVSGEVDPPANPLIIPQECIRFPDISNVGVTGRHYTTFVMVGQHAFNTKKTGQFYWKDEAITHDLGYLSYLGINEEHLVFNEDVWVGGGNFGPCIEYFADGLELGNCVFMQFEELPDGGFRELSTKVIDMGAGLERLCWITWGSPVSYDVVFGPAIQKIKQNAGIKVDEKLFLDYAKLSGSLDADESASKFLQTREEIAKQLGVSSQELVSTFAPLHAAYACADHLKTILFTSTDGMLPSNSGGGYNLRMILRRVFGFDGEFSLGLRYEEVLEAHAYHLRDLFPKLKEGVQTAIEIVDEERKKYLASKEKSKGKVANLLAKGKSLSLNELKKLYESDGIPVELVAEIAKEKGVKVEIPENFYSLVRKADETGSPAMPSVDVEGLQKTNTMFYDGVEEFDATVLAVKGDFVILDATAFYPEGGGQIYDIGWLNNKRVINVQKEKGVILHQVEDASSFKVGQRVHGKVDGKRRRQIAIHHTCIHLINACARQVLGPHIWQAGAYKDEHKAHIDLTHFRKITQEELDKIEELANSYVLADLPIKTEVLGRIEAERKYGFRLYQGGAVPGKELRVVSIGDIDHQACGGTHNYNKSTAAFGFIKIIKREGIQDGVERVIIKAGLEAVKYVQERERLLKEAAEALAVPETHLKATAMRFFSEWKEKSKEVEKLHGILSKLVAEVEVKKAKEQNTKQIVLLNTDYSQKLMEEIASKISSAGFAAVISNKEGMIVAATPKELGLDAIQLLKSFNAKGGGSSLFARGKINPT